MVAFRTVLAFIEVASVIAVLENYTGTLYNKLPIIGFRNKVK